VPWHLRQSTSFLRCFENKYSAMLSVSSNVALVCNRLQASGADPSWLLSKHNINNYYLRFKRYLHLNLFVLTIRGNALQTGENALQTGENALQTGEMLSKPEKMLSFLEEGTLGQKNAVYVKFHFLKSICFSCKPDWNILRQSFLEF
jgi:hypothetical protein